MRVSFARSALLLAALVALSPQLAAQSRPSPAAGSRVISGTVTGPNGGEAGVWVIAETSDLPTKYAKIVVTDDRGRFLLPDLPGATFDVWVRGYGLVDSPKVRAAPGRTLDLAAVPAPNPAAAAAYYPALYWYSMMGIPDASQFGGKGTIPEGPTQIDWLKQMKNIGCVGCHQLGQAATRTFPPAFVRLGTHEEIWLRRIQSGQAGEQMVGQLAGTFGGGPAAFLANWTERVANGELPHTVPTRPEGVERNVVITSWEWHTAKQYMHDLIASDRRNPTVNAYGPLFGSPEYSTDVMPILDPKTHTVTTFTLPVRDPSMLESLGPGHAASVEPLQPSAYWGDEKVWSTRANNHNAMMDRQGRVWLAANVRGMDNPAFCRKGSDHPSAKLVPLDHSPRQVTLLDPRTMRYSFVDTCFGTHHLQFGYDARDTLWLSGTGPVAAWIDTKTFDETGDAARAQGWSPFVLDTNGNGRRDEYTSPGQPADSVKDTRILPDSPYAVMPSPVDGSIWFTVGTFSGTPAVLRFVPGANPAETGLAEIYNVPLPGFGIRGGDIDRDGVVWASLSSGHLASFDRRKCKGPLNGPTATGNHCPKAGHSTSIPARASRGSGRTARSRATIPGLTSTTRSAWARTSPCPRPILAMAWWRSRMARWCRCACPTRSAFMPRASMAASTIQTPAGKAAACGPPAGTVRRG